MCGISCIVAIEERTGLVNKQDKATIKDRLTKSLEQIRHRGPNSTGIWISQERRVGKYWTEGLLVDD